MQDSYNKIVSLFTDKTFIKFVLVGMVNVTVGATVMFVFYNVFHFSYWVSSASNYIVGSIVSYFLNRYFTFSYHGSSWKSIAKFIINIAVCYVIAYSVAKPLMMWLLSGYSITVQENVSMTFGMCLFTALNYLGQRFFAFKQ
jgi:putative flippase GtrA